MREAARTQAAVADASTAWAVIATQLSVIAAMPSMSAFGTLWWTKIAALAITQRRAASPRDRRAEARSETSAITGKGMVATSSALVAEGSLSNR